MREKSHLAEAHTLGGVPLAADRTAPRVKPAGDVARDDLLERGESLVVEERRRVGGQQRHLPREGGGARDVDGTLPVGSQWSAKTTRA